MARCVVCEEQAELFCKEDKANLCVKCDKMIHDRNVVAAAHTRIPIQLLSDEMGIDKQAGSSDQSVETAATIVPQLPQEEIKAARKSSQQFLEFDVLKNDFTDFFRELDSSSKEEMFSKDWDDRLDMGCNRVSMNFDTMEMLLGQKEGGDDSSGDQDVGHLLEPVPTGTDAEKSACVLKTPFSCILQHPIQKVDSSMSTQTHFQHNDLSPPPFGFQRMMNSAERCSSAQESHNSTSPIIMQPSQDPDRAAKLARYRAKRARRNFKKTIRYESRKAYAEIRPRIKGRFATKAEVEAMKLQGLLQQQECSPQHPPPQTFPPIQVNGYMQGFEQMQQGYMVVPSFQQQQ